MVPTHGPLTRRGFLGATALCGLTAGRARAAARADWPQDDAPLRSDLRITRVKHAYLRAPRWKTVGRNSQLGLHGDAAGDAILVIETDGGVTGVGQSWKMEKETSQALLGADPLSFWRPGRGVFSPLEYFESPLWDLIGKVLGVPVWLLLGGYGPDRVPVYDGSIYFTDIEEEPLWPEELGTGVARVLREVEHSLERGHRAFKIKVGRGNRWMKPAEDGLRRDIEVVKAIRKLVGPEVKLMVDANNGYDLETTKRFLSEVDDELHFVEEPFEEDIPRDLELKTWLAGRGWRTLLADGESAGDVDHFVPYIRERAVDVLQGDIHGFGFTRLMQLARLAAPAGIVLAPHNWGSSIGLQMQVQLGRGIPNFGIAEEDPGVLPYLEFPGYELADGRMRVPDTPGLGFVLHADELEAERGWDWVVEEEG